jgi:hypothetical protein
MVNNCVNPICRTAFRLLESGDLYALERQTANTEFFWLCPECASRFELHLNAWGGVVMRFRGEKGEDDLHLSDVSLSLVAHAMLNTQKTQQGEEPGSKSSIPDTSGSNLRLHSF